MKIAFVGKGGSGKSTLSSLFIRFLQEKGDKNILAIDADLNMNLAGLLGVVVSEDTVLAQPQVAENIRKHLMGSNPRIQDHAKFLPTTPPGRGSNLVLRANDFTLGQYAAKVSKDPVVNLLTVGSYDRDSIGQTCYHSHLFVAENILAHTVTGDDFTVVCDMVAGTDAFAYSMHLQFDAIVLIAEPTPESTEVCKLYLDLADESGVAPLVHIVGNKVEDDEDVAFIRERVGKQPVALVPAMPKLKKARQRGEIVESSLLDDQLRHVFSTVEQQAVNPAITPAERLQMLYKLHHKLNAKKWVQQGYGDVADQIDPNFVMAAEKVGLPA
ncbi:MAG: ATP-binding protein [Leptolyngbya sp.]|nr:ATP-binding protein [Candidatus Melainabacteria bacterium]